MRAVADGSLVQGPSIGQSIVARSCSCGRQLASRQDLSQGKITSASSKSGGAVHYFVRSLEFVIGESGVELMIKFWQNHEAVAPPLPTFQGSGDTMMSA